MREPEFCECDACGEKFDREDMHRHEDGNLYCETCNYATKQDIIDGYADDNRWEI